MHHARKWTLIVAVFGLYSAACGGLLGVDFGDARPLDDAAAAADQDAGEADGDGDGGTVSVDGGDAAACGACGALATCLTNVCVRSVVLFGGMTTDVDAGTSQFFDDTWLWDGQTWRQAPATATHPSARADVSVGALSGNVLLYGGANSNEQPVGYGDTWSFSTAGTWTDTMATSGPYGREGAAMGRLGTKLVLFGGWDYDDVGSSPGNWIDETWDWDGQLWTQHMIPGPTARRNAALAPLNGKLVLFGGSDKNGKLLGDTWEWDGNAWTQRTPAHSPPERAYHSMATLGSKVVMFGGDLGGNRVWQWDGTDWTSTLTLGPVPRVGAAMASFGGKVVVFGGQNASGKALSDTWEWDGAKWTQRQVSGPSARMLHAMVAP